MSRDARALTFSVTSGQPSTPPARLHLSVAPLSISTRPHQRNQACGQDKQVARVVSR